jgi:cytochrome c-type biogenesis protein CcmE
MKARHQRIALLLGGLAALGVIVALVLTALSDNLSVFYAPADIKAGKAPQNKVFRVGGLVEAGSLIRQPDGVSVRFVVTDNLHRITVHYKGILPDLFQEGKGAVAQGRLNEEGIFVANEVLAKHDENYMPPEVAQALEKAHREGSGQADAQTVIPASSPQPTDAHP